MDYVSRSFLDWRKFSSNEMMTIGMMMEITLGKEAEYLLTVPVKLWR